MASVLIRHAHALDLDLPFERADVLIDDSRIVQVAPTLDVQADRSIEASGKVLMPGLINAHTHSSQILERGYGDGVPLDHAGAPFDIVDAGMDALMQAYVDMGFRTAVAMSVGDLDFFQTLPCSLVPDLPVPSMSPIAYLDGQGWLSDRLSCAHGVWLGEDDMRRLAATGTTVALGADGAASNDNQNMWEVVKLTGILHRVYGQRSDWDSAETALRLCLQVAQQLSFPASRSWRQMPMNVRQSLVRVHRDRGFIMALG